jgi:hypothetical protein
MVLCSTFDIEKLKFQIPSTKLQISIKHQGPNDQNCETNGKGLSFGTLEFGIYLEFGICDLEFKRRGAISVVTQEPASK